MNAPEARITRRSNLDAAQIGRTAPLPISWYFDPGWFEREMLLLFEKGPGYVGHELMVPNVGDYYTLPWTEHGKVLLRGEQGVGLLSNTCRHRQGLLLEGKGNAQNIVCPLHRWTYDLDGKLLGAAMVATGGEHLAHLLAWAIQRGETAQSLLQLPFYHPVVEEIREVIAERGAASETAIADLHVWRVGKGSYACALSLVTHDERLTANDVRKWLAIHDEIVHSTIEIHRCPGA